MTTPAETGFTLIETLVAMAVLAVAAGGLVRATAGHVDLVAGLQTRLEGSLAAENALAEQRVGVLRPNQDLLHHAWHVSVAARPSDDPDINSLTLTALSGRSNVALRAFGDRAIPAGRDASGPVR